MGSFSCRSLNRDNRICSRRNSFKNIDSVSETALVDSLPYRNLVRVLSKSVVSRRQAVLFQDATLCPSYQEKFFFFFWPSPIPKETLRTKQELAPNSESQSHLEVAICLRKLVLSGIHACSLTRFSSFSSWAWDC